MKPGEVIMRDGSIMVMVMVMVIIKIMVMVIIGSYQSVWICINRQ